MTNNKQAVEFAIVKLDREIKDLEERVADHNKPKPTLIGDRVKAVGRLSVELTYKQKLREAKRELRALSQHLAELTK